jgi:site-specific DNA-cytosine methylase
LLSFDSQFGSYAGVHENISPPVKVGSGVGISSPPAIAYSIREDAKANTFSATEADTSLALNALRPSPQSHHAQLFIAQAIPIQDGREIEKRQNGFGVGEEGDPSYTLDTTGAQSVAQPVVFENSYRDGPRVGKGVSHTLPAKMGTGGGNTPMIAENSYAVRRLTPIECERLMGWPDDHTRWKADGTEQADSHRYKQCGNGVATPVARWIAEHIGKLL